MNLADDWSNAFSRALSFPRLEFLVQRIAIGAMLHSARLTGLMKSVPVSADSPVHQRTKVIAEEAAKRGWSVAMLSFLQHPSNIFELTRDGRKHVFEGLPGLDPVTTITKVDDKDVAKKLLRSIGAPVPEGKCFSRMGPGLKYGLSIGFPLVVKPRSGSLSAHTTVNITNEEELERAIRCAQQISPSFVVERYVVGHLYRATTVGEKVVAVGRRDPPTIVGDGLKTVRQLVAECEAGQTQMLLALGYKPEEVPSLPKSQMQRDEDEVLAPGEALAVTWKINLSYGASVTDVTDDVHPDNLCLFEAVAKAANLPSLGIDFLAPSVSRPWREQICGIIELNSLPSIDLHHPPIVKGTFRNVAAALLDFVYKDTIAKS